LSVGNGLDGFQISLPLISQKVTQMLMRLITKMEPNLTPTKKELESEFNFTESLKSASVNEDHDDAWRSKLKAKVRAVGRMQKIYSTVR